MKLPRVFFASLAVVAAVAGLVAARAAGQVSANTTTTQPKLVEAAPDGGRGSPIVAELPVVQHGRSVLVPVTTEDGKTFYRAAAVPDHAALDAESRKLLAAEQGAAEEARAMAQQALRAASEGERADAKKKLREKLLQIFDLQQQRRNHEISRLEERLGKLKDTLKKRDAAKDSIVDRRLETLTGGVDELGWEDTFGGGPTLYGPSATRYAPAPRYETEPRTVPPPAFPRYPAPAPAPVPVPPAPPAAPAAAVPPVAPAPPAVPAPPAR